MNVSIGKFDITGSAEEIALIRKALRRCDPRPGGFLTRRITVRFEPPPPTSEVPRPYARVMPGRVLLIRPGLAPGKTQYLFLHEIAHFISADWLSQDPPRKKEIMALMSPVPTDGWWGHNYRNRPEEIFADSYPEAVTDLNSFLDSWYLRTIPDDRLPELRDILIRPLPVVLPPPEPEPPPETTVPVPPPPDACP